uniref:Uncharacterized protein n=1 Tax=Ditylenchus dipsaci TaxID=166011 RepID=A0A915DBG7_9BILA
MSSGSLSWDAKSKEGEKQGKLWQGTTETTDSSSKQPSEPNQMPAPAENKADQSYGSDTKHTINEALDSVLDTNELKEPLRLLTAKVYSIDETLSSLQADMRDGFRAIDGRFAHFLGSGKDSVATGFELICKKWMQEHFGRDFLHSHRMQCTFEKPAAMEEEIDLFSYDAELTPPLMIGECTVALISEQKLQKCIRKKNAAAKQHNLPDTSVVAYILTMRISPLDKEHLTEVATKNGVILQIIE